MLTEQKLERIKADIFRCLAHDPFKESLLEVMWPDMAKFCAASYWWGAKDAIKNTELTPAIKENHICRFNDPPQICGCFYTAADTQAELARKFLEKESLLSKEEEL